MSETVVWYLKYVLPSAVIAYKLSQNANKQDVCHTILWGVFLVIYFSCKTARYLLDCCMERNGA